MSSTSSLEHFDFSVRGMHCAKCIRKVQSLSSHFQNIQNLNVNFASSTVSLDAPESFRSQDYEKALQDAGFEVRQLESDNESKSSNDENATYLIRIAVAGACAGNIMLLAISGYSGADVSEFKALFHWLSFALFLPVFLFSAWPIYVNSYTALLRKRVSVDIPLAIAIVGAAILSTYSLIVGSDKIYFDSLSMFIFFLISSRYFIYRLQKKYLAPIELKDLFGEDKVSLITDSGRCEVPISKLNKNDIIEVRRNSNLPVDGELVSEVAEFDNALFTGESLPVTLKKFDRVFAGTKLISAKAQIKVVSPQNESRAYKLIEKINTALLQDTTQSLMVDKGAHYLSIAIVTVAAVFLGIYAFIDIQEGLERVLALLVVACPCALAIATPLAHSLTLKKAMKSGILIKNIQALEKAQVTDAILFDKTGTLTSGDFKIQNWEPCELSPSEKEIVYNLEKNSEHPIARAILRQLGDQKSLDIKNITEVPGKGILGEYAGSIYEICSNFNKQEASVAFKKDGVIVKTAMVADELSESTAQVIHTLRLDNKELYLISGDKKLNTENIGKHLGFKPENIFSESDPQRKSEILLQILKKHPSVMFVGDGINDALSMAQAQVSISTKSAAEITFKSSNIHFLKPGIGSLNELLQLSKRCLFTIKGNILLSFIYNSSFAVLALLGMISPLVAVILMPSSSLLTVLWTLLSIQKGESK